MLNMLGGMDTCDEGTIMLDGEKVSSFSQKRLTTYRRYDVGFVFQFYNLVQNLTARENVELAAEICRDPLDADTVLEEVGLSPSPQQLPGPAFGRRTAAGFHCPGTGQEPENPALRRTHRCAGL